MELEWSKQLSVGNDLIDSEHRDLLKVLNEVESAIRARDSSNLPRMLRALKDCVSVHFADEERIAQAIGFDFTHNKREHEYVQNELAHMSEELVARNGLWSESAAMHYSYFLSEWMVQHILQEDMLMKPLLQTYPCDFKPD